MIDDVKYSDVEMTKYQLPTHRWEIQGFFFFHIHRCIIANRSYDYDGKIQENLREITA